MATCLGCGTNPHAKNCPEDLSVSRQARWARRKVAAGLCRICGKKSKGKWYCGEHGYKSQKRKMKRGVR